jgi:hypothetical protein
MKTLSERLAAKCAFGSVFVAKFQPRAVNESLRCACFRVPLPWSSVASKVSSEQGDDDWESGDIPEHGAILPYAFCFFFGPFSAFKHLTCKEFISVSSTPSWRKRQSWPTSHIEWTWTYSTPCPSSFLTSSTFPHTLSYHGCVSSRSNCQHGSVRPLVLLR